MSGMALDAFLALVASESNRTVDRDVDVPDPALIREVEARGSMPLTDYIGDPRKRRERRTFRYGHVLGAPRRAEEVDAWQRQWPTHRLPQDLASLLLRVDGIHLWADLDTGRAYEGLAPLAEWQLARTRMYGPSASADLLSDHYLALTYHSDGAAFVVLDVRSGGYYLMDAAGPDTTSPVGRRAGDLLDYLWSTRIAP